MVTLFTFQHLQISVRVPIYSNYLSISIFSFSHLLIRTELWVEVIPSEAKLFCVCSTHSGIMTAPHNRSMKMMNRSCMLCNHRKYFWFILLSKKVIHSLMSEFKSKDQDGGGFLKNHYVFGMSPVLWIVVLIGAGRRGKMVKRKLGSRWERKEQRVGCIRLFQASTQDELPLNHTLILHHGWWSFQHFPLAHFPHCSTHHRIMMSGSIWDGGVLCLLALQGTLEIVYLLSLVWQQCAPRKREGGRGDSFMMKFSPV